MIHFIEGEIQFHENKTYIKNNFFGIEVIYSGEKTNGEFFLFPYMDETNKTITYYGFDTAYKKSFFEKVIKISGIGPKTGHALATLDSKDITSALDSNDIGYLRKVPGIGPKTAKRLLVELQHVKKNLGEFTDSSSKKKEMVIHTLVQFGYEKKMVESTLSKYTGDLMSDTPTQIVSWILKQI